MHLREILLSIIDKVLKTITPKEVFNKKFNLENNFLKIQDYTLDLSKTNKLYVIGFGKASSAMATEIEKFLYDRIEAGIVITKYGFKTHTNKIKVFEAAHPIPDENTIHHSKRILKLLNQTYENDLIISLISGGGSALFEVPIDDFSLDELKQVYSVLLHCGANIYEINAIRKLISKVKGGKLLSYIYPSQCISIIISDVIGNDLSIIASGPTFITSESKHSTREIIQKYYLKEKLSSVSLEKILSMEESFNKFTNEIWEYFDKKVQNIIIASNENVVISTKKLAEELGYKVFIISEKMEGEARLVASNYIKIISDYLNQNKEVEKFCFISGGETTVTVRGDGIGGRNTEFALSALYELIFHRDIISNFNFILASIATDGNDGTTDCAGAFVDYDVIKNSINKNLNPKNFLTRNDSYTFFSESGGLIKTAPTFTNVMDIVIGLFERKKT